MENPVVVPCPADEWTLIGSDIRGTRLHRIGSQATNYVWTYRLIGDPAPTDPSEGKSLFDKDDNFQLPKTKGLDFYVYPHKKDGSVRLDEYAETIDTFIQDQTTPFGDFYFLQPIGISTTLTADITGVGTQLTIDVASVASISVGDYLGIFSGVSGEERFMFSEVLAINVLELTLDSPVDFGFVIGDIILSFTRDLNVDGSITPQIFEIQAGSAEGDLQIDITRLMMQCLADNPVTLSTFCDIIGGIINGLVLREKENGFFRNKWNVKTNGDLAILAYDWDPFLATNPAQGQDGFKWRFSISGREKHGVAFRVIGDERTLQLVIQDDLTTVDTLRCLGANHEVD